MPVSGYNFSTDIHSPLAENSIPWRHDIVYYIIAVFSTLMNRRPSCFNFSGVMTDVNYESETMIWTTPEWNHEQKISLITDVSCASPFYPIGCWDFCPLLNWLSLVSESPLPARQMDCVFFNHKQVFNSLQCSGETHN